MQLHTGMVVVNHFERHWDTAGRLAWDTSVLRLQEDPILSCRHVPHYEEA
jgi:hypothetical protein